MTKSALTTQQLEDKLTDFYPFQFEGGIEILAFKESSLFIDEKFYDNYLIKDSNTGFKIELRGLLPFQKNILLDFGEEEQCLIINHEGQKLIDYPSNLRHWASVEGFFILKSIKAK